MQVFGVKTLLLYLQTLEEIYHFKRTLSQNKEGDSRFSFENSPILFRNFPYLTFLATDHKGNVFIYLFSLDKSREQKFDLKGVA